MDKRRPISVSSFSNPDRSLLLIRAKENRFSSAWTQRRKSLSVKKRNENEKVKGDNLSHATNARKALLCWFGLLTENLTSQTRFKIHKKLRLFRTRRPSSKCRFCMSFPCSGLLSRTFSNNSPSFSFFAVADHEIGSATLRRLHSRARESYPTKLACTVAKRYEVCTMAKK